jgi:L-seryl-tRNA(Ser) seleniumtransferase
LYLKNDLEQIPNLKMLRTNIETLEQRANTLKEKVQDFLKCEVISSLTMVGGGTTPNKKIPTIALAIEYKNYKPNKIEELLRKNFIIARIENDRVLLDFRTIQENELEKIEQILKNIFTNPSKSNH